MILLLVARSLQRHWPAVSLYMTYFMSAFLAADEGSAAVDLYSYTDQRA